MGLRGIRLGHTLSSERASVGENFSASIFSFSSFFFVSSSLKFASEAPFLALLLTEKRDMCQSSSVGERCHSAADVLPYDLPVESAGRTTKECLTSLGGAHAVLARS